MFATLIFAMPPGCRAGHVSRWTRRPWRALLGATDVSAAESLRGIQLPLAVPTIMKGVASAGLIDGRYRGHGRC